MSRTTLTGISNPNDTGPINLTAGHCIWQSGLVVQVNYIRTDARNSYSSPASGNGTTITDLNLTIVPKFSTSLLVMTWMINGEFSNSSWNNVFLVHKNGSLITDTNYQGYNFQAGNSAWSGLLAGHYDSNSDSTQGNYLIQYSIPAMLASSQTFAPAVRSGNNTAYTWYLNRCVASAGSDNYEVTISTGVIMEIAQ